MEQDQASKPKLFSNRWCNREQKTLGNNKGFSERSTN